MPLDVPDPVASFPDDEGKEELHLRPATLSDVATWLKTWQPELEAAGEWSATWDWQAVVIAAQEKGRTCLALCRAEKLDGLMSLSVSSDECSRLDPPKPLVYVEWIDSAPHNRKKFGRQEVRNVTAILLRVAVDFSRQLGFSGRIGLHSGSLVESYYEEHVGLTRVAREQQSDGKWLYFEGTPEWAQKFWPLESEESGS